MIDVLTLINDEMKKMNIPYKLKTKYKTSAIVDGIVITYENMFTVKNGSDDLKQIQINMTIKKWSV